MGEIKSALEIAMERADRIGKASKKELEESKWTEEGRRIAAKYLKNQAELKEELGKASPESLPVILKGVTEILLRNIVLPRQKEQWPDINRALDGIIEIKGSIANQVVDSIKQLLEAYEQTKDRYLEQLRLQMQGKLGGVQQAIAQQYGMGAASNIDVESLPEFQQEWSRISSEISEQFDQQLSQFKAYIEHSM